MIISEDRRKKKNLANSHIDIERRKINNTDR